MKDTLDITASIVLYKEDLTELTNTINCFLNTPLTKKLFLIDNTSTKLFEGIFKQSEIEYIPIGKNIGFGAGHNIILDKIKEISKYHLILNPDVSFNNTVISNLIEKLKMDETIAMIAPKVLFPNGKHQYSCRRYPTIIELFVRRVPFLIPLFKKKVEQGMYKDRDITKPFYAEYVTGCFQLYNTEDFIALDGFDERYFLYMEDVDICKKIEQQGKNKLYFPIEKITHVLKKGSEKNFKLFLRHTFSMMQYFKKWK